MFELNTFKTRLIERFFSYVKIDTRSDPHSSNSPSTEKQKKLGELLVKELNEMGLKGVELDTYGYVYAQLPANTEKVIPAIAFCSHMDTSPDESGEGVKPILHSCYQGQDLILPDDPLQVIKVAQHPDLAHQIGNDIITASGKTLLGADNKAGISAIMTALQVLAENPSIKHGPVSIVFTPDEEIGRGTDNIDLNKVNAAFGYTIDGETLGSVENETFSANGAILKITGNSTHPGFAKNKMVNALKVVAAVIDALPKNRLSPETTENKEGFIHPTDINGNQSQCTAHFILRDFEDSGLKKLTLHLEELVNQVVKQYPGAGYELHISEQYRNMKKILDQYPHITNLAVEAIKKAGLQAKLRSIRGGTDGSRLSFMGLPCPNVFAGEHAFHSKQEWVSVQDMLKASETILHIVQLWEAR